MSERLYVTERTRMWRTRELKPYFASVIDHVEEYGCHITSVAAEELANSWTYTVGVFDAYGKPELVTVGLPREVAHSALHEAVRRMRRGVDLTVGRHKGIVGDVDVEFRPVHPRWQHHIMLSTDWYYEEADVPALQLIFPDLENHFAGEPGFDSRFAQPALSGIIEHGSPEYDFWIACSGPESLPPLLN